MRSHPPQEETQLSEDVIIERRGPLGRLSLDRPKALHALTQGMCEAMSDALLAWRSDPSIEAVLIDHAAGRGFCAGGDVALVRRSALEDGGAAGRAFFFAEYRLNHLLFTYPKPLVAFMDGVTMGGGVGISQPAKYRIATESTLFAMPEGAIGLFPDVGAGWYLPRLQGRTGAFMALTGARLDGAECLWAGLATHYLPSERLPQAKARMAERPDLIGAILDELSADPPEARIAGNAERIDRLFAYDSLEEIIAALAADRSQWAAKELKAVAGKCPTTAKVALREMAEGAARTDFADEMRAEYRLAARMMLRPDFAEGVRAVLIDKDNAPRWHPAHPEDVTPAMLDEIFAPLPAGAEWTPFTA
jgi:enoyl-CoA hydratase